MKKIYFKNPYDAVGNRIHFDGNTGEYFLDVDSIEVEKEKDFLSNGYTHRFNGIDQKRNKIQWNWRPKDKIYHIIPKHVLSWKDKLESK